MTAIETSSKNLRETWTAERVAQLKSGVSAGLSCAQKCQRDWRFTERSHWQDQSTRFVAWQKPRCTATAQWVLIRRPQVLTQRLVLRALFASAPIAEDVVSSDPCSLLNLAPRTCRWPISGVGSVEFTFCGNTTVEGMSYCAGHARMAYRGSSGRPQEAPRVPRAAG